VQRGETKVAVSAAVSAVDIVSKSRISAHEDHAGSSRALTSAPLRSPPRQPDLALVDDAALVAVQELDRVLDGEDVLLNAPS